MGIGRRADAGQSRGANGHAMMGYPWDINNKGKGLLDHDGDGRLFSGIGRQGNKKTDHL